jgi:hypothetical protein
MGREVVKTAYECGYNIPINTDKLHSDEFMIDHNR